MFDVKPKPPPQWTERYTFPANNRELESIQALHMEEEEIKLKEIHYKLHKKNKGYLSAIQLIFTGDVSSPLVDNNGN